MDLTAYEIALAGLIHDVGKIGQRAFKENDGLTPQSLGMENLLCPLDANKRHTHRHVLYTNEFCEAKAKFYPPGLNAAHVANLASYHHQPENDLQRIIQEADRLSSAMERIPEEEGQTDARRSFRRVHLKSIAGNILLQESIPSECGYALSELYEDFNPILPSVPLVESADLNTQYRQLWESLIESWNQNRVVDPWKYLNRCVGILEPYAWCVPSATNVRPDISLFDHLKTTSAIAACLHRAGDSERPFLLVAGDYGGIQNYLFELEHGAGQLAKGLRGRSFYVRLYSEAISLHVLKSCDCSTAHRIMNAGGRFYLLLPNHADMLNVLESSCNALDGWILKQRNGELRFALAWTELTREDFKDFPSAMSAIGERLSEQKQKSLGRALVQGGWKEDEWLRPRIDRMDGELCTSCRKQFGTPRREMDGSVRFMCQDCWEDRQDGGKLTHSAQVSIHEDNYPSESQRLPFFRYRVLDASGQSHDDALAVLDFAFLKSPPADVPLIPLRLARHIPRDAQGEALDFQSIAEKSHGRKILGYLKVDVDNLGFIFKHGFRPKSDEKSPAEASISRLATLSRNLEIFFASYFEQILSEQFSNVYLVYSGGDDLLAIGPWDQMFDLAITLRQKFRDFTCGNPNWGLSAGIAVANPRTPVLQAVKMVSDCLEASKKREGKDSLTAFGSTFTWPELERTIIQARKVLGWLEDGTLNSGKMRRLLGYAEMFRNREKNDDKNIYLRYIPQMIYDLKRNWGEKTSNEKEALTWAQTFQDPSGEPIRQLYFICQYALNGIRG